MLARGVGPLTVANDNGRFSVVVVDPPWAFDDSLGPRGAEANYACLPYADLLHYQLPPMAADSVLFLWRVASMQQEALTLVEEWGYTLKTELVWLKRTTHGKQHFGMGRIVRASHETCLIATKGRPPVLSHSVRSTFEAETGRHSEKPDTFYRLVEMLYAGPYVDVFARKHREGWTCIGDELVPPEKSDWQREQEKWPYG
jgi:N6-adenosine-specific RNA methylase IME4